MFVHFVFHSSLLSSVFQPHDMLAYFKTSLILTWTPLCTFPPWIPVDVDNWYSIRFWPNMSSMTKRCSKTVPLFLHSFTDEGRLLSFNQPFLPLDHRSCQIMNWVTFVSPILNSTHEWMVVLWKQFWVQDSGSRCTIETLNWCGFTVTKHNCTSWQFKHKQFFCVSCIIISRANMSARCFLGYKISF